MRHPARSAPSFEVHVGHVDADFSREMHKSAHQKHERQDKHHRHDLPVPDAQKPCEKGENEQRGRGERTQDRKIDGAAQEFHPAQKRSGQYVAWINVRVRRSKRFVLVGDAFETRNENRQERRDGAQHEGGRRGVRDRYAELIDVGDESQERRL